MKKKACFITGANSGIGKAAAVQIAAAGFTVVIGCRNEERGKSAVSDIKKSSGSSDVELVIIDMSSKQSIRDAADRVNSTFESIDVLIHNAADFDISRKKPLYSADGIESVWATNYIGPMLLTDLFLDRLKTADQGRIINVASQGLVMYPNLKVHLADPEFKQRRYTVSKAYYQSKLAHLMYTYWLAGQLQSTGITVNCIRVTKVKLDLDRYPDISKMMKLIYSVKRGLSITPDEMAETYTYLAVSPELSTTTGKYFNEKRQMVKSSKYSLDPENINRVMDLAIQYLE
jgi:NAD(P)-dependent dehydrogenase (short-subunit alcohol dehydrogenase family)